MKTEVRSNWRVTVYPTSIGDPTEKECRHMAAFLEANLRGLEASATCDKQTVCSFCGSIWEAQWDVVDPECCERAVAERAEEVGRV